MKGYAWEDADPLADLRAMRESIAADTGKNKPIPEWPQKKMNEWGRMMGRMLGRMFLAAIGELARCKVCRYTYRPPWFDVEEGTEDEGFTCRCGRNAASLRLATCGPWLYWNVLSPLAWCLWGWIVARAQAGWREPIWPRDAWDRW